MTEFLYGHPARTLRAYLSRERDSGEPWTEEAACVYLVLALDRGDIPSPTDLGREWRWNVVKGKRRDDTGRKRVERAWAELVTDAIKRITSYGRQAAGYPMAEKIPASWWEAAGDVDAAFVREVPKKYWSRRGFCPLTAKPLGPSDRSTSPPEEPVESGDPGEAPEAEAGASAGADAVRTLSDEFRGGQNPVRRNGDSGSSEGGSVRAGQNLVRTSSDEFRAAPYTSARDIPSSLHPSTSKSSSSKPDSPDSVRAYARSLDEAGFAGRERQGRGCGCFVDDFWGHYEGGDPPWTSRRGEPIRDWRYAFRRWIQRECKLYPQGGTQGETQAAPNGRPGRRTGNGSRRRADDRPGPGRLLTHAEAVEELGRHGETARFDDLFERVDVAGGKNPRWRLKG